MQMLIIWGGGGIEQYSYRKLGLISHKLFSENIPVRFEAVGGFD